MSDDYRVWQTMDVMYVGRRWSDSRNKMSYVWQTGSPGVSDGKELWFSKAPKLGGVVGGMYQMEFCEEDDDSITYHATMPDFVEMAEISPQDRAGLVTADREALTLQSRHRQVQKLVGEGSLDDLTIAQVREAGKAYRTRADRAAWIGMVIERLM